MKTEQSDVYEFIRHRVLVEYIKEDKLTKEQSARLAAFRFMNKLPDETPLKKT